MLIERRLTGLALGCEQLFDLAADVERYPEFLRGWRSARVVARYPSMIVAEQVIALGPLTMQFRTNAVLRRPTHLDITSDDEAFRRFAMRWRFAPTPGGTASALLSADVELRSGWPDRAARLALPVLVDDVAAAFAARARALQTAPGTAPRGRPR